MKIVLASITIIVLALAGCRSAAEQKNDQLQEEIIRVHDLAMEKIGYMYELEVKLEQLPGRDKETEEAVREVISHLKNANTMMFDWMHQYQPLAVDDSLDQDSSYRERQLLEIRKVQELTNDSIRDSEQLLESEQL